MLDLADALAGKTDALADLLKRHGVSAVEAVAELEDLGFALDDAGRGAGSTPVEHRFIHRRASAMPTIFAKS